MLTKVKELLFEEEAQGMTEYIIIVALIALVAIAGVKIFGKSISGLFQSKAGELEKGVVNPEGGQ